MTWWDEMVSLWWPKDYLDPREPGIEAYYQSKYDVAQRIRPRMVIELGVRAGYSGFAFLSATAPVRFLGIDFDDVARGTNPGAVDWAAENVLRQFDADIIRVDTAMIKQLPAFDLLHVDAAHDYDGVTADLNLALRSVPLWKPTPSWVLVDDYDSGPETVKPAVDDFLGRLGLTGEHIQDGYRGQMLFALTVKR